MTSSFIVSREMAPNIWRDWSVLFYSVKKFNLVMKFASQTEFHKSFFSAKEYAVYLHDLERIL